MWTPARHWWGTELVLQMILRHSLMACVSTALTICVRWWSSQAPTYTHLWSRSTSETIRSITHCVSMHPLSSSSPALFLRTILNMTDRFVTACTVASFVLSSCFKSSKKFTFYDLAWANFCQWCLSLVCRIVGLVNELALHWVGLAILRCRQIIIIFACTVQKICGLHTCTILKTFFR